jgi:tRNA G18 (ribose-2'-O)-methylase SpoU
MQVIAAEITPNAVSLSDFSSSCVEDVAVIFGNEIEGVLPSTLEQVDRVVKIPMQGIKESLNIGQSAAIFMWELGKYSPQ